MAEEKRQAQTAKELQESAEKVGRPMVATEDLTREAQLKTEERFREREVRACPPHLEAGPPHARAAA